MSQEKPPEKTPVQPLKPEKPEKPDFSLKPVTEKPKREYRKGSKYDPLIDAFINGKNKMVTVSVEGKDANYMRTQIAKRLDARNIKNIEVSVVNNVCYLQKI